MVECNKPNQGPFSYNGFPLTSSNNDGDNVYEADDGNANDSSCRDEDYTSSNIEQMQPYFDDTRNALSALLENIPLDKHMPSYLELLKPESSDLQLSDKGDVILPLTPSLPTVLYSDKIAISEEDKKVAAKIYDTSAVYKENHLQKKIALESSEVYAEVQKKREEEIESLQLVSFSFSEQESGSSIKQIEEEDVNVSERGKNGINLKAFSVPNLRKIKVPASFQNLGKIPLQVPKISWNSNSMPPGRVELVQDMLQRLPNEKVDDLKEKVINWLVDKQTYFDERKANKHSSLDNDEEEDLERNSVRNHNVVENNDDDGSKNSVSCSVSSMTTSNTIPSSGVKHLERFQTLIQKPLTQTISFVTKKREKKHVIIFALTTAVLFLIVLVSAIAGGGGKNDNKIDTTPTDKTVDVPVVKLDETYEERMMRVIRSRSPTTVFDSKLVSPSSRALDWMLKHQNNLTLEETYDDRFIQRFALVTLWYSTNGENWDHGGWLEKDIHECEWDDINDISGKDVHCDVNQTVMRLELDFDGLTGSIPDEIALLTNLSKLSLHDNALKGTIPSSISSLSGLTEILLENNDLSGTLPAELSSLTSLFWLRLENNQLSGTIPTEFGNLQDISWLLMHNNTLSGTVPHELSRLSNLSWLALNHNKLSGLLPYQLGELKNIFRLSLEENYNLGGSVATLLCSIPRVSIKVDLEHVGCSCCTCCD